MARIVYPRINLNGYVREVRASSEASRDLLHELTSVLEALAGNALQYNELTGEVVGNVVMFTTPRLCPKRRVSSLNPRNLSWNTK